MDDGDGLALFEDGATYGIDPDGFFDVREGGAFDFEAGFLHGNKPPAPSNRRINVDTPEYTSIPDNHIIWESPNMLGIAFVILKPPPIISILLSSRFKLHYTLLYSNCQKSLSSFSDVLFLQEFPGPL